ncbi:bifunctional 4-hydroxy-2-oxoglutarate aldolase/2-dehydro-3-deoxy-phosphogluconate aldolase [Candidatus Bathyarchaeota archaeon]|nr:bifunctional 4-hydroxy-2-oxoglutarate aldolase/2-dehydro-3-deoxy-phosphogluconate aldolase [Candidatus Bathyarchaeota archaeon]
MAKFMRHEVIGRILELGLTPIFYHGDLEVAKKIVQACADGGAKVIEFTNRGDFAYQVFSELNKWCNREFEDVILGVGSVIDPATAALYINCGANFIVGPIFNSEIAKICNRRKVAYIPGCASPSEISAAEEMGCDIVKIFPGSRLKPDFIKALLGPCPWVKLMPTGGVDATRESIGAWIKAGAAAVGIGSRLIRKDLVKAGDFEAITKKVEECLWWVQEARGTPLFLGVEHVGIYSEEGLAAETAEWYAKIFGFEKKEGRTSFFASGRGPGRIEIIKEPSAEKCHIAIRVSNFEAACEYLKKMGIELEEPKIGKGYKSVFLKNPDPAGNRIHILYLPP